MFDGRGIRIGEVVSDSVKLNQGIRKQFGGRWLAYAFATRIRDLAGVVVPASGWIEQASLADTERLHGYTLELPDPGEGEYEAIWVLTGDNSERYSERYIHAPDGTRYPATDYLVRPYGFTHLTYNVPGFNLGGFATDSFLSGVVFHRSRGASQIEVPLYTPRGFASSLSLNFIYGYFDDGENHRYGWIAREALTLMEDMPDAGVDSGPVAVDAGTVDGGTFDAGTLDGRVDDAGANDAGANEMPDVEGADGGAPIAEDAAVDAGPATDSGGCGCATAHPDASTFPAVMLLMMFGWRRMRR